MVNPLCPDGTGVKIETMDGQLDLADVSWQLIDSRGRLVGICYAATGPDEFLATPAQALADWAEGRGVRVAQMVAQGYTVRAREHHASCDEYKTVMAS